ncbi:aldolase catalytic domain-containing protein [Treponema socranskii]|uniref:aldolase catalytic domain-containing protein n=1 Tax=Treponema socranskii TaxID=53419 RepID=UPI003D900561
MERDIALLDCTLRDGGYVNNWNFGHSVITGTYKRLDKAGVDYIEVGFLDSRKKFDINRTIAPDTQSYNRIFQNIVKRHAMPVAMIDFGTCDIRNIQDVAESFIEGIRVIFKKEKIEQALPFCKEIKDKGYKLFIQAISITAYSDLDMLQYIEKINDIEPYAFSIVDTYGLLDKKKLKNYFNLMDNNLKNNIKIGYHGHNNFQLAFSNSIEFLATDTKRDLIVDSTIYGMGKSAGNCPSELLAMHINQQYGKNYDVNQFLEVLDTDLMSIYEQSYWGYRYNFYISAMQNCHPAYVSYLLDKKTLTVTSINEILTNIPEEQKLLYDEEIIKKLYIDFQSKRSTDSNDLSKLKVFLDGSNILLIGPGHSIVENAAEISKFIKDKTPIIISVNFYSEEFKPDFVFVSNSKRYGKLLDTEIRDTDYKLIVTSNISTFDKNPDFRINYSEIRNHKSCKSDSSLILMLSTLNKIGINEIYLAGFDGFTDGTADYCKSSYSFGENSKFNLQLNEIIKLDLLNFKEDMSLNYITQSLYQ